MMRKEEEKKDERYSYMETKPIYSSNVLIGHWFNSRYESQQQSSTAVVPCVLLGENIDEADCERHVTTNQEEYSLEDFEPKDMSREYIDARVSKYKNFMTQRANIRYMDEKYYNNYTSLNTLVYDLWPKMIQARLQLEAQQISKEQHLPDTIADTLDCYGNHSSMKRPIFKKPGCPVATSYKREFPPRWAGPVQKAKMSDMLDRLG